MTDHADSSDRRAFFKSAADKLIEPVAKYLDRKIGSPSDRSLLRPPGSIHKERFNDVCQRCGECVKVCPANAIIQLPDSAGDSARTPTIDPSIAACVVCEGLLCTHVCPSGAILPVYQPHLIAIGIAEIYAPTCVRTNGEDCDECVVRCPFGEKAIKLEGSGPPSVLEDCTGCGICEFYCPTTPKAITIRPH